MNCASIKGANQLQESSYAHTLTARRKDLRRSWKKKSPCSSILVPTSRDSANMPSTGFAKMCFVLVALQVLLCRNLVSSSSIYVGRHEAGTISEQGPSESLVSEVNTCEDANKKVCRKIINFYGEEVCDTHDESLLSTVQNVCQSTCGFCTNEPACEDQVEDLCKEYGNFCNRGGDLGGLIKELCPKTCKSCHLKASKEESSLVVINE